MRGGMLSSSTKTDPTWNQPLGDTELIRDAKGMTTERQTLTDLYLKYYPDKLPELETLVRNHGYKELIEEANAPLDFLKRHGASYNASTCEISPPDALVNKGITDVSPLASLTSLKKLDLHENEIVDVSHLETLTDLTVLALSRNQIRDVSPLATLTSLKELYLYGNQIVDVKPLATLTSLKSLHLGSNQIVDKTSLNHLKARINW